MIDHLRSDTAVPVEGLPSFLSQEMVSGALKVQDEEGYPASVTIAQIILESGFGTYGAGGGDHEGLTELAYEYHNLFAMRGDGTDGSVSQSLSELKRVDPLMASDDRYRAYFTDMESIDDRTVYLKDNYSSVFKGITDSDDFAMALASKWSSDRTYGLELRKIMKTYDLYRLDDITLDDFESMLSTYVNPCPGSHYTSGFGWRDFDSHFHLGVDLATGSRKIPTYAADGGEVISTGYGSSTGNMIVIRHDDGRVTKYMHHSEMYVKAGDRVIKGQQIGLAGTTGHSTGIHLHFQLEINGEAVNPLPYLADDASGSIPFSEPESSAVITEPPVLISGLAVSDSFSALPNFSKGK